MKYVKMLGLAAVAAAALMAFVGASTASATVLCKTSTAGAATCPANEAWPAETTIHAVSETKPVLTTGSNFTEITCNSSTVHGKTTNEGNATETVFGNIEKVIWEGCSTPNGACTVTTVTGGTLEVHWIAGSNSGTLTGNGTVVTSNCASIFGNIHCIYEAATEDLGTLTGGKTATADFETTPINIKPTSSLCPEGPKWDAKFLITEPDEIYVANET